MKTVKLVILVTLIAIFSSCGERRMTDKKQEIEAPGVGMAEDSANQKLDSAIKSADTTHDVH
jgi:hypothetical protein